MRSTEALITAASEYYIHQPSAIAAKLYLYPAVTGYFYYEPGYYLRRNSYDNYLIMYIKKGECSLVYNGKSCHAKEGQIVLIDCHCPHEYGNLSKKMLEVSWLHFDGILAKNFYDLIIASNGNVFTPSNPHQILHNLKKIQNAFSSSAPLREAELSRRITDILSELVNLRQEPSGAVSRSEIVELALSYINEHFAEELSLEKIAEHVSLSPYSFSRMFAAETGFTPHQYLIATRLDAAKYLLLSTGQSVKEIAFLSGFRSESSFCATFRKWEGVTPGAYRTTMQE